MNPFTALVWDVIQDSPEFLEHVTAIMRRNHTPFLIGEKAFQANAKMLESYVREELDKWYEWLPDTPINRIGGGLAVEMLTYVDWYQVARLVQETILHTPRTALKLYQPGGTS